MINSQLTLIEELLHELKTPLSVVRSHLESELGNEAIPLDTRKMLVLDVEEIARLNRLINEMKMILECEMNATVFTPASMVMLLMDTIEFLEPLSLEKKQTISLIAAKNITFSMDEGKMKQLCFNLIHNAIKYTRDGGKIEVELIASDEHIDLYVRDSGDSIPKEKHKTIFKRFYRIDPTHSEGSGLGLSICAAVATLHHGTITLRNLKPHGNEFHLSLPKQGELHDNG